MLTAIYIVLIGIVSSILCACVFWFVRKRLGFTKPSSTRRMSSIEHLHSNSSTPSESYKRKKTGGYQIVPNTTPTIQVSTVEFTLPANEQQARPSSWAEGMNVDTGSWSNEPSAGGDHLQLTASGTTRSKSDDHLATVHTKLGLLKPELYMPLTDASDASDDDDVPTGNMGRVWFRLEYDVDSERLIVTLQRMRNLPGRAQRSSLSLSGNSSCDPFARVYLLPDEKRYLQTTMKRRTRSPTFNETFMFTMSYTMLVERALRVSVFDVDRFMRQSTIGHVVYPLKNLDVTTVTNEWSDLEKTCTLKADMRVQVGLTLLPAINRVNAAITHGVNLGAVDDDAHPDTYVRATLSVMSKVVKSKKTHTSKGAANPNYDTTLSFKVEPSALELASLRFDVFREVTPKVLHKNDRLIGSFILGGAMVSRGKGAEHWAEMAASPQLPATYYHDLEQL